MKKNQQFIVLGLGRFGSSVAQELYNNGTDVLAVDLDSERVADIQGHVTHAIQADASDPNVLQQLGVKDFDVAIVNIGTDIKASGVITMLLKEMGVPRVISKAQDEMHGRLLQRLGADQVIYPERDMGRRLAHRLLSGNILDYIELSDDFSLVEISPLREWLNRSLGELNLRKKPGINVIAIRSGGRVCVSLNADTVIQPEDQLLVIGERAALHRLEELGGR